MNQSPDPTEQADPTAVAHGCGALPAEALELAAQARADASVPVDPGDAAHIASCRRCALAVGHIASDLRLLAELAQAAAPSDAARAREGGGEGEREIPGYRLADEIHRGSQGAVFTAEQLATRRRCAVKMLIGGRFAAPAQRMRFEREIEVVAAMRHPSIVTLYESGVSWRGEPWFAMEFVEGERLDEFVRRTAPPPRAVADLLRRISEAIAYAHRRGVIHRDLKPGNILVDRDGVPRVLDFGLARSVSGAAASNPASGTTIAGEFAGTFAYAAPEQLVGDPAAIDGRCDLYALGVLLYECLAGVRPHEGAVSIGQLVEQKTGRAPRAPGEIARARNGARVDADLDVIAMRLLDADPARRYDTADALAEDLARYLDGRPILARADSLAYVATKALRRHRVVSAVAGAFLLTLVGGGIALAFAYRNAEQQRVRVERAYQLFRDALESADPELGGGTSEMNVGEYLAVVEKQIRTEIASDPELVAEILQTLGIIRLGFDDSTGAAEAILRAHEIIRAGYDAGRVPEQQFASACVALAKLRFAQADYAGSESLYRSALASRKRSAGAAAIETVDTQRQLASALRMQGKVEEADELLTDALALSRQFPAGKLAAVARAAILNGRAVLASQENDHAYALEEFSAALEAIRPYTQPDDFRIGRTLYHMARAEFQLRRFDDAEGHAREALGILRVRKGDSARSTLAAAELLAEINAAR